MTTIKNRESQSLDDVFGIDLRGLAAMRIGLGSLILFESIQTAFSLPANDVSTFGEFFIAYHKLIIAPFAVCFTIGLYTRPVTCICWLIYMLGVRHNLLNGGTDLGNYVLALFLFWSIFLPAGSAFSVDSWRTKRVTETKNAVLVGWQRGDPYSVVHHLLFRRHLERQARMVHRRQRHPIHTSNRLPTDGFWSSTIALSRAHEIVVTRHICPGDSRSAALVCSRQEIQWHCTNERCCRVHSVSCWPVAHDEACHLSVC